MAKQITRWYKQPGATEASYDEAESIGSFAPAYVDENINIKNIEDKVIFQTFDEDIRGTVQPYHITTQFSIKRNFRSNRERKV